MLDTPNQEGNHPKSGNMDSCQERENTETEAATSDAEVFEGSAPAAAGERSRSAAAKSVPPAVGERSRSAALKEA